MYLFNRERTHHALFKFIREDHFEEPGIDIYQDMPGYTEKLTLTYEHRFKQLKAAYVINKKGFILMILAGVLFAYLGLSIGLTIIYELILKFIFRLMCPKRKGSQKFNGSGKKQAGKGKGKRKGKRAPKNGEKLKEE